jgi:3',5'-cyclic AMP phosphodiesterase CpdA
MLLCQISDLHIKAERKLAYGRVDTAGMLERCVAAILRLAPAPDAVLITGDLVDRGSDAEYELLAQLIAPLSTQGHLPVYLIAGNHDERDALRRNFPAHTYLRQWAPFVQYAIDAHALRIVALDTVIPGQGGGLVCAERLDWLDRTLSQAPEQATVILMHHPPFITGIGHMDRVGLDNSDALEAVVRRHPQVERVLCGHLHRSIQARFGGTVASTCPSTAHQVALDLGQPSPDNFVMEPPGYQLHFWNGKQLVTHTAVLGDFAGPYPFRTAGKLID